MTDMTEPWPPVPGTGPVGPPATPPPTSPELPQAFQAPQPGWAQQPAMPPPTLGASYTPAVPLPAEHVVTAPTAAAPRRRRGGLVLIVALIVVGLVGVLGGGALLAKELTRKATRAEQAAALATELASRWQRLPAGEIFPATVTYQNEDGAATTLTRVGIATEAPCQTALEPGAFQQIRHFGCVAMLRATYVGAGGSQAVTVGVAAFPPGKAAENAQGALEAFDAGRGLNALPFSGTVADTFGNAQRGASDAQFFGSYVLLYTVGYTDGLPGGTASVNDQLRAMGNGILIALEPTLTKHTGPCTMKDIKC